ncbi:MAG: PocR ligand-binding domain-containing protein, partial [Bacteroidales bacterium]|nr:PocR ligand-binding domain-containing protein [Bacteroidales bacterium]
GWQDICTQFHRVNPKTCQHCIESDTILSAKTKINTFKTYKCRNNMWDMSTPMIIGNQHMGNLFLGQFFYDDEEVDIDFFKKQAHTYGFNEKEYVKALDRVPRYSRKKLDAVMRFYTKLAQQISTLGYKNLEHKYSKEKSEKLIKSLEESEEKYRMIADNTSDGIFVLSNENVITYVSPAYMKLMGLQEDAHFGASSSLIYELIHQDDRDALFKMIFDAISKNVPELKYEFRVKHSDGHYFWREDNARFIYDEKGKYGGSYVVCRDITERKNTEERLTFNEAQLRELNATKDKLFSIIAHDLRSPFSSIINLSDMLLNSIQAKESFEEQELYAENLRYSSKRAYDLLINLLEWSRSQAGKIQFSPYILGLKTEVAESMELYMDVAQQKSIIFEQSVPSRTLVHADKPMLQTILRNLISNAIKFTMPGGSVNITAESTRNEVIVSVKDTGIGIPKEMIDELFVLGKETGRSGTGDEPSSGLGLLLCKDFVEKHGGRIWVESEEGKGSTFKFSIPVSPDRKA